MINTNIKRARENAKISQRELGRRINKTGQYISYLEGNCNTNPPIETLNKIAAALNVSVNDLISDSNTIDISSMSNEDLDFLYGNPDLIALKDILLKVGYILEQNGSIINIFKNNNIVAAVPEADFIEFGKKTITHINEFSEFQINKLIDTYEFLGD